jgi:hypothetical protein
MKMVKGIIAVSLVAFLGLMGAVSMAEARHVPYAHGFHHYYGGHRHHGYRHNGYRHYYGGHRH